MGAAKETAITPPSPVADTRTDTHTQTLSDGRSSSFPLIRPARRVGITSWATTRLGFSNYHHYFHPRLSITVGGQGGGKFCKQRGGKIFALQIVQLRLETHSDKGNWLLRCFAVYTFVGAGRFSPPYSPGAAATAGVDCRTCVASAPRSLPPSHESSSPLPALSPPPPHPAVRPSGNATPPPAPPSFDIPLHPPPGKRRREALNFPLSSSLSAKPNIYTYTHGAAIRPAPARPPR